MVAMNTQIGSPRARRQHRSHRSELRSLFLLALFFGPAACTHVPRPPLPDEIKAQIGSVAVTAAQFAPTVDLQAPAKGGVGGAGRGLAVGAATGTAVGAAIVSGCNASGCGLLVPAIAVGTLAGA